MFGRRSNKAEITAGTPQMSVRYAGCTETYTAHGVQCTAVPVQRVWDNSVEERHMRRCELLLTPSGITLIDSDKPANGGAGVTKFDIRDISYISAELERHDRVFSWVYRDQERDGRLYCHVVVCPSRDKARTAAILVNKAFQLAYRDWKGNRERQERLKLRSATHLESNYKKEMNSKKVSGKDEKKQSEDAKEFHYGLKTTGKEEIKELNVKNSSEEHS